MQLLVSVRNAAEAAAALAGGADIIDAKEPLNGPLGTVSSRELQAIIMAVGRAAPVSAALGDAQEDDLAGRARAACHAGVAYVKIGFAAMRGPGLAGHVRNTARAVHPAPLVLVAYADFDVATAPAPGMHRRSRRQVEPRGHRGRPRRGRRCHWRSRGCLRRRANRHGHI